MKNAISMVTFPKGPTAGTTPAKVTTSSSNAPANSPGTKPSPVDHRSGLEKMLDTTRSRDYPDCSTQAAKITEAIKAGKGDGRGGVSHQPPRDL